MLIIVILYAFLVCSCVCLFVCFQTRSGFEQVFFQRIVPATGMRDESSIVELSMVLTRIFDLFDIHTAGVVDFRQFAVGLTLFCGGQREDKLECKNTHALMYNAVSFLHHHSFHCAHLIGCSCFCV